MRKARSVRLSKQPDNQEYEPTGKKHEPHLFVWGQFSRHSEEFILPLGE